jgi:hypothetical protein
VEQVRQDDVVDVAGRAGGEADVLEPRERAADPAAGRCLDRGQSRSQRTS